MTPDPIAAWAAAGESEAMEFKQTTGERREGTRTLCGMLNGRGGQVIYGVRPDGRVVGQQVADKTLEDVAQEVKEIDPPAFPSIDRVPVAAGREVVVVGASQGQGRPYSYKGQSYKRVGNTTPAMSRDEYNRMLFERMHGEFRWENRPADDWTVADLDLAEVARTLDEAVRRGRIDDPGTRNPDDVLRGFGLSKDGVLLRAAIVLFGRRERVTAECPQMTLRVARFRGTVVAYSSVDFSTSSRKVHGRDSSPAATAGVVFSVI